MTFPTSQYLVYVFFHRNIPVVTGWNSWDGKGHLVDPLLVWNSAFQPWETSQGLAGAGVRKER